VVTSFTQEAGVTGTVGPKLGPFDIKDGHNVQKMWLLFVDQVLPPSEWEESTIRERRWVTIDEAPALLNPEVPKKYVLCLVSLDCGLCFFYCEREDRPRSLESDAASPCFRHEVLTIPLSLLHVPLSRLEHPQRVRRCPPSPSVRTGGGGAPSSWPCSTPPSRPLAAPAPTRRVRLTRWRLPKRPPPWPLP